MNQNEVFYFQTVEIQWFAKGEMNCDYLLLSVINCNFANEKNPCVGTIKQSANMKQFIVIDQLRLNEKGALVCKKPSGRLCSKVHFKQGTLTVFVALILWRWCSISSAFLKIHPETPMSMAIEQRKER